MQITVCSKENARALGDFTGPLVHSNIQHAHTNHPSHIFSTSIAGSKVERYTEAAEHMVWICRVLLLYVLPSHFSFIINQCEFKSLGSRDCLFSYMCVDCASFFMLSLSLFNTINPTEVIASFQKGLGHGRKKLSWQVCTMFLHQWPAALCILFLHQIFNYFVKILFRKKSIQRILSIVRVGFFAFLRNIYIVE